MSAVETQLPAGFESLQPFVPGWAIEGADARHRRRIDSTEAERAAFFEAVGKVLTAALEHLDRKPLAALDPSEKRLMNLLLSFAHVAQAVELQRDQEPMHAVGAGRITITRATADIEA
jgi:hypothetical protein